MSDTIVRDLGESLLAAVGLALSDMAFVDALETPKPDGPASTSHIVAVGFSRPVRGTIALYLPLDCKKLIVENVYACDWDTLSAAQIDDCLLELGNIVAGNFLVAYCGDDSAHDVSLPQLYFDDTEIGCDGERAEVHLDAEGHSLSALVCLDG